MRRVKELLASTGGAAGDVVLAASDGAGSAGAVFPQVQPGKSAETTNEVPRKPKARRERMSGWQGKRGKGPVPRVRLWRRKAKRRAPIACTPFGVERTYGRS